MYVDRLFELIGVRACKKRRCARCRFGTARPGSRGTSSRRRTRRLSTWACIRSETPSPPVSSGRWGMKCTTSWLTCRTCRRRIACTRWRCATCLIGTAPGHMIGTMSPRAYNHRSRDRCPYNQVALYCPPLHVAIWQFCCSAQYRPSTKSPSQHAWYVTVST